MTENLNSKGKQDFEKEIEELESQIIQLDEELDKKLVEFTNLQEKRDTLGSDKYQEEFKKIEGEVRELRVKRVELCDRKRDLEKVFGLQKMV